MFQPDEMRTNVIELGVLIVSPTKPLKVNDHLSPMRGYGVLCTSSAYSDAKSPASLPEF